MRASLMKLWVWVAVIAAAAGACGEDAATTVRVSAVIGAEGGVIQLADRVKVEIPKDALERPITITITELSGDRVAPLPYNMEASGKPYAFEPHGQLFALPVKIELPFDGSANEVRPMKLPNEDADTEQWTTVFPSDKDVERAKLGLETTSFSVYIAARPRRESGVITLPDGAIASDAGLDAALDDAAVHDATMQDSAAPPDSGLADTGVMDATLIDDAALDATAADVTLAAPLLTALSPSIGALLPALSDAVLSYLINVDFATAQITLTPTAPAGSAISIDGVDVVSGSPWTSPTLIEGINDFSLVVRQPGAPSSTYAIRINRGLVQEAIVKSMVSNEGAFAGWSVAVSGDTVVLGAPNEASNATTINGDQTDTSQIGRGAAFVFVRSGNSWTQQAYLKTGYIGPDAFGTAVAIAGDTIVVGAPNESSNATGVNGDENNDNLLRSGAAYVFVRSGTTWTQQAFLKASNPGDGDNFGEALAIDGDTIVVGAAQERSNATTVNGNGADNSAIQAGAAYVFARVGTTWTQEAYLKANNSGAGDQFGDVVDVSGDIVVVGAFGESSATTGINGNGADNSATQTGAAYAFVRAGSTWTQEAYLKASNAEIADQFGISVGVSGNTIVVGSRMESSGASGVNGDQNNNDAYQSGAAYVFVRGGTTWTQEAYLKASHPRMFNGFGDKVAISGDTIAIVSRDETSGALGVNGDEMSGGSNSGAIYELTRSGSVWTQRSYIKQIPTDSGDTEFGWSLDIDGQTIVVGAPQESTGGNIYGGGAFIFR